MTQTTATNVSGPQTDKTPTMRAIVYNRYGPPDAVVELREISRPQPGDDGVLVRVAASSVNALDWHFLTGIPFVARLSMGLRRPKRHIPGADIAGTVEAVGKDVTRFSPGDEVFGETDGGGFAEYAAAPAAMLAHKPASLGFEAAAALGVAALTALQGLRDWGAMRPGQRVLINGASGGVGTFAVQLARALGASHVSAVCSTRNVDQARTLGADLVIDYTKDDFTTSGQVYDLVFDNVGNRRLSDYKRVMTPDGTYVVITGPKGRWIAPIPQIVKMMIAGIFSTQTVVGMKTARPSAKDLVSLGELVVAGKLSPVIEQIYPLADAVEVLRRQGEGHARAKTVVKL